jgi:hypothetical protein
MNELFKDLPDGWYQWNLPRLRHLFCEIHNGIMVRSVNNGEEPGKHYDRYEYILPQFPAWPEELSDHLIYNRFNSTTKEPSSDFFLCHNSLSADVGDLLLVKMSESLPEVKANSINDNATSIFDLF